MTKSCSANLDGYALFMGSVTTHAINPALYTW